MKKYFPSFIAVILLCIFTLMLGFFLIIAMNGYSESDGLTALGIYAALALLSMGVTGTLIGVVINFVSTKFENIKPWITESAAVLLFTTLGGACIVISGIFSVGIMER